MHKEYVLENGLVKIYDVKDNLEEIREANANIDEILMLENYLEVLDGILATEQSNSLELLEHIDYLEDSLDSTMYISYGVFLINFITCLSVLPKTPLAVSLNTAITLTMPVLINLIKNSTIIRYKKEEKSSELITKYYKRKFEQVDKEIDKLKEDKSSKCSNIIEKEPIGVQSIEDYLYELTDSSYNLAYCLKHKNKLKKLYKSNKLDNYFTSIGCSEEDKKIYKEILGFNFMDENNDNSKDLENINNDFPNLSDTTLRNLNLPDLDTKDKHLKKK